MPPPSSFRFEVKDRVGVVTFNEDGRVTPVTVIEAGPCVVVQRKTRDKDGYSAVQVGLVLACEQTNYLQQGLRG